MSSLYRFDRGGMDPIMVEEALSHMVEEALSLLVCSILIAGRSPNNLS